MAGPGFTSKGHLMSNIWRAFKQLNPNNVKEEAERSIRMAVVAPEDMLSEVARVLLGEEPAAYDQAADALVLLPTPLEKPAFKLLPKCDIVLRWSEYDQAFPGVAQKRIFEFSEPGQVASVITSILKEPSLSYTRLPLARAIPAFRREVATDIIQSVSIENSIFVVSTALGNVIPNPLQPLASLAEAMGDLVVLTANQLRMLFRLAAAYNRSLGFKDQMPEIMTIVGAAFGWRTVARNLVSKLPLGAGLVPKAGIAFAGTWAMGDGIVYYYNTGQKLSKEELQQRFDAAYAKGKSMVEGITARIKESYSRRGE